MQPKKSKVLNFNYLFVVELLTKFQAITDLFFFLVWRCIDDMREEVKMLKFELDIYFVKL